MPLITIEQFYGKESWGIVRHRRDEIENGPFGSFEKIVAEEFGKRFCILDQAGAAMRLRPRSSVYWLRVSDARFIIHNGVKHYFRDDLSKATELRSESRKPKRART